MDMSSSDEELVGPNHSENYHQNSLPNQLTILPTQESINLSQDQYQNKNFKPIDNQPDVNSKENTEIMLCNILFPADYDFERDFVIKGGLLGQNIQDTPKKE